MLLAGLAAHAQRMIVRVLNADTGLPMSHESVVVQWGEDADESVVYVGGQGRGELAALDGSRSFTMRPAFKEYGEPNRPAYFSCSGPVVAVDVETALRSGFVARNDCSTRTATAGPGEIVFWARPLPKWRPDFQ